MSGISLFKIARRLSSISPSTGQIGVLVRSDLCTGGISSMMAQRGIFCPCGYQERSLRTMSGIHWQAVDKTQTRVSCRAVKAGGVSSLHRSSVQLGFSSRSSAVASAVPSAMASSETTTSPDSMSLSVSTKTSPLEKLRLRARQGKLNDPNGWFQPEKKFPATDRAPAGSVKDEESFADLGLSEELLAAVEDLKLEKPTEIQSLSIPAVISGESVVLASHTGSGKTLAYLLPLVQALRRDEASTGRSSRARRPRAVVLCPTRELAEQVLRVAKSLCHHARFRSAMISGGTSMKPQEEILNQPLDLVIGTPGRILMHIKNGSIAYGDIRYVALDEADTMFDQGFGPDIKTLLRPLRVRSQQPGDPGFQTILVTATLTKAVQRLLDEEFPGIRHLHTSSLHKRVSTAKHSFLPVPGTEDKLNTLLQVVEPSQRKGERTMVFCNTVSSCRAVEYYLRDNLISTVCYHGEVPADQRVENLDKFRAGAEEGEGGPAPMLVCTDLAARGLDLTVDHVIMFDFPRNPIDYLHRTGRTARMGAKGKITSIITKRDQLLSRQIENAIAKGLALDGLATTKVAFEAAKKREADERRSLKEKALKGVKSTVRGRGAPYGGPKLTQRQGGKAEVFGSRAKTGSKKVFVGKAKRR